MCRFCAIEELADYDAIIFGTPTRFGNMCGQMRQFLDSAGKLWLEGKLIGEAGAVFTSSATQHGGQESTLLSFHLFLLHQGMVVVGLPYSFAGQMRNDEITGGSPMGRPPSRARRGNDFPKATTNGPRRDFQGKHVAIIAGKLAK